MSADHLAPDAAPEPSLPDLERELESLLVKYERLAAAPIAGRAMDRYRAGNRVDAVLDRIAEIQAAIANTRPRTLEDAAVRLRRALAAIDAHDCRSPFRDDVHELATRLVKQALRAVEEVA